MVGSIAWDVQMNLPNRDTRVKPAGSLKGLDEVSSEGAQKILGKCYFCP